MWLVHRTIDLDSTILELRTHYTTELYFCSAWTFTSILLYLYDDYASVQYNDEFLPDIILLPRCNYHCAVQRLEGRRGCHKFVPVLGGDGTKIVPTGGIFDQPHGEMI